MTTSITRTVKVSADEVEANTKRGGDIRVTLSPKTVGCTSGFVGVAILEPGECIAEHYHPYSEEFVYVVGGDLEVDLDGEPHPLRPDQGLLIPIDVRHRFRNVGDGRPGWSSTSARWPRAPSSGHVDTEDHRHRGAAGELARRNGRGGS